MAMAKISRNFMGIFTEIGVPVKEKFNSAILFLILKVAANLPAQCDWIRFYLSLFYLLYGAFKLYFYLGQP